MLNQQSEIVLCTDFEYLNQTSKMLLSFDEACKTLNESFTRFLDNWFSIEEVDSLDASCNTCKHFQRTPMNPEQKKERNLYGMPGLCVKKDIQVKGWQRGIFCGFENINCYENRRTNMKHDEACLTINKVDN